MSGEFLNHLRTSWKFAFNRKVVELNESFRMVFCLSRNSNPTSCYGNFCTHHSKIRANSVHRPLDRRWAPSHECCRQITHADVMHYHSPSYANISPHLAGLFRSSSPNFTDVKLKTSSITRIRHPQCWSDLSGWTGQTGPGRCVEVLTDDGVW